MEQNDSIIIIDDDSGIVEIVSESLDEAGLPHKGFTSWAEAEKNLGKQNFYLGLIDYNMPDLNGIEVCKKLKAKFPEIKFIIISGYIKEEEIREFVSLEIKDLFEKPIKFPNLINRIKAVKDEVLMQRQMNQEIRVGFVEEALDLFSEVENNVIKLEDADPTILPDLVEELFRAFHNLKGGAGAVGYMELSDLAHKAENILNTLRGNKEPVTKSKVENLLKFNDLVNKVLHTYQHDVNIDISSVLESNGASPGKLMKITYDLTIHHIQSIQQELIKIVSGEKLSIEVLSKEIDITGVQLLVSLKKKRDDISIEFKHEELKKVFDVLGLKRIYL